MPPPRKARWRESSRFSVTSPTVPRGRRFVVEPRVPQRMPVAGMAKLVGVAPGDLPGRFQLRVDGSRPVPISNGRVAGDDVVFSSVLAEPEDLAAIADREIRWFVQAGRRIGNGFAPRGGAAPADDLPWVFAATEDDASRLDLYAEGSVRTRFPRVAVACRDESAQMLLAHPDCRCWETQPIAGRVMFDVEGDVRLDTPVGACRVRTAQEQERQFEHRLTGDRCFDVEAPLPVYRQAPSLSSIEPTGARRRVPPIQLSLARGARRRVDSKPRQPRDMAGASSDRWRGRVPVAVLFGRPRFRCEGSARTGIDSWFCRHQRRRLSMSPVNIRK